MSRANSDELSSILLFKKITPVCLPELRDWKHDDYLEDTLYWGEYTTVSGYGRVDQLENKDIDQNSCQLLKGNLKIQPSYEQSCKKVRYIYTNYFFHLHICLSLFLFLSPLVTIFKRLYCCTCIPCAVWYRVCWSKAMENQ